MHFAVADKTLPQSCYDLWPALIVSSIYHQCTHRWRGPEQRLYGEYEVGYCACAKDISCLNGLALCHLCNLYLGAKHIAVRRTLQLDETEGSLHLHY